MEPAAAKQKVLVTGSAKRIGRTIAIELFKHGFDHDVGDAAAVHDLIVERRDRAEAKVQRYERLRDRILDGRGEDEFLATAPRVGPYLTLMRGISYEEENVRWAERALTIVEQRQGAGSVR